MLDARRREPTRVEIVEELRHVETERLGVLAQHRGREVVRVLEQPPVHLPEFALATSSEHGLRSALALLEAWNRARTKHHAHVVAIVLDEVPHDLPAAAARRTRVVGPDDDRDQRLLTADRMLVGVEVDDEATQIDVERRLLDLGLGRTGREREQARQPQQRQRPPAYGRSQPVYGRKSSLHRWAPRRGWPFRCSCHVSPPSSLPGLLDRGRAHHTEPAIGRLVLRSGLDRSLSRDQRASRRRLISGPISEAEEPGAGAHESRRRSSDR